jgi:hypothetical protein
VHLVAFAFYYIAKVTLFVVPVGKDSEPSFEVRQPGWKHAQLLFEKKSLIPAVQQLIIPQSQL